MLSVVTFFETTEFTEVESHQTRSTNTFSVFSVVTFFETTEFTVLSSMVLSNNLGEVFLLEGKSKQVIIDRSKSGKTDFSDQFADQKQTLTLGEAFQNFQLIIDQSSVEILINNGKYSLTNQFFPNKPLSNFKITANGKRSISSFKFNSIEVPVKE